MNGGRLPMPRPLPEAGPDGKWNQVFPLVDQEQR
jgi:hypothetical protein